MKYVGKTIIGLAHERGANGHIKKISTAWRYLLSHKSLKPASYMGWAKGQPTSYPKTDWYWGKGASRDISAKSYYIRYQWEYRVDLNGEALCHAHGYRLRTEVPGELLPHHIKYRSEMIERIDKALRHTYSFSTLPRAPQDWNDPDYYLCIADRTIVLHRSDSASWDSGSKSHWPSSTSVSRTADLLRDGWDDLSDTALLLTSKIMDAAGEYKQSDISKVDGRGLRGLAERSISYEARGNWLQKIIVDLLGIAPERQRGLSHIQLDPHYRIALIRKIAGIEIWQRSIAGEIMDYCAVRGKDTYHAATPCDAVHGLSAKLATPGSRRENLDMNYALSLGFCRVGIEQFCDDYNLDYDAKYTRAQIQSLIVAGNGRSEKYEKELVKAGFTV